MNHMTTLKKLAFLCMTLFLTSAMAVVDEKSAIANVTGDIGSVLNNGQASAIVKLYTDNAVVMPPSSEILTGQAAIKQYWDGLRKAGFYEYNIYNVAISTVGDTAYQTGLWQAVRKDTAGNIIRLEGNISNVLAKQKDGTWKIKMQSWN